MAQQRLSIVFHDANSKLRWSRVLTDSEIKNLFPGLFDNTSDLYEGFSGFLKKNRLDVIYHQKLEDNIFIVFSYDVGIKCKSVRLEIPKETNPADSSPRHLEFLQKKISDLEIENLYLNQRLKALESNRWGISLFSDLQGPQKPLEQSGLMVSNWSRKGPLDTFPEPLSLSEIDVEVNSGTISLPPGMYFITMTATVWNACPLLSVAIYLTRNLSSPQHALKLQSQRPDSIGAIYSSTSGVFLEKQKMAYYVQVPEKVHQDPWITPRIVVELHILRLA